MQSSKFENFFLNFNLLIFFIKLKNSDGKLFVIKKIFLDKF